MQEPEHLALRACQGSANRMDHYPRSRVAREARRPGLGAAAFCVYLCAPSPASKLSSPQAASTHDCALHFLCPQHLPSSLLDLLALSLSFWCLHSGVSAKTNGVERLFHILRAHCRLTGQLDAATFIAAVIRRSLRKSSRARSGIRFRDTFAAATSTS
ncbi:hypothetical protein CC78DRAFT_577530 [Lojkania enalia]|uniref:Uncharacterized protein n=1 Tax=Lojkania enalia TaxID=147567 RepID=A0A9P4KI65_9PLEO|nr:hypothetical protein CC78DRAFT_577530 [Didymosphaeria enalia]